MQSPALILPPLSQLNSRTPNESSLYLANSLAMVVSEPDLHRLLIIPCIQSHVLFLLLRSYQRISPDLRQTYVFCNKASFYGEELLVTHPICQLEDHPLVCCPWLLMQNIPSYPPCWRPFPHPQPRDTPCHGDRDPLIMDSWMYSRQNPYFLTRQNTTLHEAANNIQLLVSKCCTWNMDHFDPSKCKTVSWLWKGCL